MNRKRKKRIVNAPDYKSRWGYKDKPFNTYDELVVIPRFSMDDGKGTSVALPELKRVLKKGKTYRIKPTYLNKRLRAELLSIYSDPIGFGNKGKNTDVRLRTEWKFKEGQTMKGRHEFIEDINIDYRTRTKKRDKVLDKLWHKHGMKKQSALKELKRLIKQKKI